jgi:hypothetical protein
MERSKRGERGALPCGMEKGLPPRLAWWVGYLQFNRALLGPSNEMALVV